MNATRRGEGFGRSASDAALRGALLVAVAVIIGALLIWRGHKDNNSTGVSTTPATTLGSTTTRSTVTGSTATTRPGATTTKPTATVNNPPVGATRAVATVKVMAANGSGVSGLATKVNQKLITLGYATLGAVNAKASPVTNIYYRENYQEDAKGVAAGLGLSFDVVQAMPINLSDKLDTSELNLAVTANVVVILGADNLVKVG